MKVLVTHRLPEEVLALIKQEHEMESYAADPPIDRQRLLASIAGQEGLLCTITDCIDAELLEHAPAPRGQRHCRNSHPHGADGGCQSPGGTERRGSPQLPQLGGTPGKEIGSPIVLH